MRLLFVGDIVGKPGRRAVAEWVPRLRRQRAIDLVVANGENAASGAGINDKIAHGLWGCGVDVITTGNHAWDKREALPLIEEGRLLRPANYPNGVPGVGSTIAYTKAGDAVGVMNLQGRVFMKALDCPFRVAKREIDRLRNDTIAIVVDFHAEATSEKLALGWYLDGEVAAVIGTHTHVQTADERVLPGGTAYITDVGMSGPFDSVIGMDTGTAIQRLMTGLNPRLEPAKRDVKVSAVIIDIDMTSGHATSIERMSLPHTDATHPLHDDEDSD
jgi:hypothetical protein